MGSIIIGIIFLILGGAWIGAANGDPEDTMYAIIGLGFGLGFLFEGIKES